MKNNFPTKRIIAFLSIALAYTFIFAIVGNCEGYSQAIMQTDTVSSQEETINSDTYFDETPDIDEEKHIYQISLRKAGISEYSIFDDYENVTLPVETTVQTTTAEVKTQAKPVTTAATTKATEAETSAENFTIKPQQNELNSGTVVESNPVPPHTEEVTMTVTSGGQVVTLPRITSYNVCYTKLLRPSYSGPWSFSWRVSWYPGFQEGPGIPDRTFSSIH